MDDCICIQTSQHALLCRWGPNHPAAANQPWPFTTSLRGNECVCLHSCESERTHTHLFVCVFVDALISPTPCSVSSSFHLSLHPVCLPQPHTHLSPLFTLLSHPCLSKVITASINSPCFPPSPTLHLRLLPAGETISSIPLEWKEIRFNMTPSPVMFGKV